MHDAATYRVFILSSGVVCLGEENGAVTFAPKLLPVNAKLHSGVTQWTCHPVKQVVQKTERQYSIAY